MAVNNGICNIEVLSVQDIEFKKIRFVKHYLSVDVYFKVCFLYGDVEYCVGVVSSSKDDYRIKSFGYLKNGVDVVSKKLISFLTKNKIYEKCVKSAILSGMEEERITFEDIYAIKCVKFEVIEDIKFFVATGGIHAASLHIELPISIRTVNEAGYSKNMVGYCYDSYDSSLHIRERNVNTRNYIKQQYSKFVSKRDLPKTEDIFKRYQTGYSKELNYIEKYVPGFKLYSKKLDDTSNDRVADFYKKIKKTLPEGMFKDGLYKDNRIVDSIIYPRFTLR